MVVAEKIKDRRILEELQMLPEVEYPQEKVDQWKKEVEITKAKLATGEIVPQTVEELIAELGINTDGWGKDDDEN